MKNKKYSIVYSSLTGNTKVLADAIHEALPQDECEYFGVSDTVIPSSELLYIGFWTDKGHCRKQCYRRRVYVSGQNAAVCPGTLIENEGSS